MSEALAFLTPEQVARLVADYTLMVSNLSAVQERCTELLTENRDLRAQLDKAQSGILLPGWVCRGCGIFNGEQKEKLDTCRVCDAPKHVSPARDVRHGGWTCVCGSWNADVRTRCRHCDCLATFAAAVRDNKLAAIREDRIARGAQPDPSDEAIARDVTSSNRLAGIE